MTINKLSFSRLLKLELPELAERVIGVVETYDFEVYKIKGAYDQLVAQQPQIDALLARYKKHALTETLKRLREERARIAAEISSQVRYNLRENREDDALREAKVTTDQFLLYLRNNNKEVSNRKITQFFTVLKSNQELAETMTTLGLLNLCDSLESTHAKIQRILYQRTLSLSSRPKGKTKEFSESVRNALKLLFSQIEVAHAVNQDIDYTPMISAINEIILEYKNLINSRAGYNKKTREEANDEVNTHPEEGEKPEEVTLPDVESSPEATVLAMDETSANGERVDDVYVNGSNGELARPLEQKKTAVLSSKSVQLPSVNNEA